MKCANCGGALAGTMTFCPYCGVRQEIDLRQVHFRDLGSGRALACPSCEAALVEIEFDITPALRVERCTACHGMFFNPGELQALLDAQTNPLVWLDPEQLGQIAVDYGFGHEVVYRKCPVCAERMSHVNFGGRSGVILDRCGTHGVWAEGGELRRLAEWWRAGGKLVFQQHEAGKARQWFREPGPMAAGGAGTHSPDWSLTNPGGAPDVPAWIQVLGGIASIIID